MVKFTTPNKLIMMGCFAVLIALFLSSQDVCDGAPVFQDTETGDIGDEEIRFFSNLNNTNATNSSSIFLDADSFSSELTTFGQGDDNSNVTGDVASQEDQGHHVGKRSTRFARLCMHTYCKLSSCRHVRKPKWKRRCVKCHYHVCGYVFFGNNRV